jgi:hypothetical protein
MFVMVLSLLLPPFTAETGLLDVTARFESTVLHRIIAPQTPSAVLCS